ncbi:MAG: carboxypeptidase-like regulatory domain-containing protein, partial [Candidatus Acidiferrales bacterium]
MRKLVVYLFAFLLCIAAPLSLRATIYGRITGIVHDPQHRPVQDASVVLKSTTSDYTKTTQTNADGEFAFQAVPI